MDGRVRGVLSRPACRHDHDRPHTPGKHATGRPGENSIQHGRHRIVVFASGIWYVWLSRMDESLEERR